MKELYEALYHAEAILSQLQDAMPADGVKMQTIMAQGYTGHAISRARAALAKHADYFTGEQE